METSGIDVYWSSKIESKYFWWIWSATVYEGDHEVKKNGLARSQRSAQTKVNKWLRSMGQTPANSER